MTTAPPQPPMLIFDGDCGICTRLARLAKRLLGDRAAVTPWQALELENWNLTEEAVNDAVHWIPLSGPTTIGASAVASTLDAAGWWWRPVTFCMRLPGLSWLADRGYGWVAKNRHRLPGATDACRVPLQ